MNSLPRRTFLAALLLAPLACLARDTSPRAARPRPGLDIEPWRLDPAALDRWRRAPRRPILESVDPATSRILAALRCGACLSFVYHGGSAPDTRRRVTPGLLYTVDGFPGTYLSGYCHTRRAERTFLVTRMGDITADGSAGSSNLPT